MLRTSVLLIAAICGLILVTACARTEVSRNSSPVAGEFLERPSRIIVYNFAGTPADLPTESAIVSLYERRIVPQTAKEIALNRDFGDRVAAMLVTKIRAMGMPAERAGVGPAPQIGNGVIKGEFVSIDEGNRLKRMLIGFGAGSAEMKTVVETYVVTAEGLRITGSAKFATSGGMAPGILVPVLVGSATGRPGTAAAVAGGANILQELGPESLDAAAKRTADAIAKELEKEFRKRGWI